jgi:catechol 2,3-dioxygenase-like lactoylglutathione lyase family enzyme
MPPGLHHVSVGVRNLARARAFYDPLLALVGLALLNEDAQSVDYGATDICFSLETPVDGAPASAGNGVHIAFEAPDRAAVRAFHEQAIRTGGRDAGAPGPRPAYGPHYYGAFVYDLDGNKIEAVTEQVG